MERTEDAQESTSTDDDILDWTAMGWKIGSQASVVGARNVRGFFEHLEQQRNSITLRAGCRDFLRVAISPPNASK